MVQRFLVRLVAEDMYSFGYLTLGEALSFQETRQEVAIIVFSLKY